MKPSYEELEQKLIESERYGRQTDITIDNLEMQLKTEREAKLALAAENAMLKQRTQQLIDIISNTDNDYCMCGSAMKDHVHSGCGYPTGMFDYYYNQWLESDNKTPATDAFLAEVRAQCLNAFIQHHSAELDAHIKNGGEQFDEKSVRIRDIIVSARLFREQIRKGAA
ncbi:TPA: hNH endonuclease, partial [Escherichia coli]